LSRWVCRCRSGKPTLWNVAPLRRGFFVRRVSGRNENPSRVVLQPDVGHGLFQGRREPNARNVTRISPLRCATDCVVLSRWVCRYSHRQALDETRLSPAAAGLFRAGPPRSAQPTARLGVGVVGLLRTGESGKPVMATNMTHLAPLTWRGFCLATPPLLCKDGAGLSANLLGVARTSLMALLVWQARPSPLRRMPCADSAAGATCVISW
jgi:hypothetical protein